MILSYYMINNLVPVFDNINGFVFGMGCVQVATKVSSPGIGRVLLRTWMGYIAFEHVETRCHLGSEEKGLVVWVTGDCTTFYYSGLL